MTWIGKLRDKFKPKPPTIRLVLDPELVELEANCDVMAVGNGRYTREMSEKKVSELRRAVDRAEESIAAYREGLLTTVELGNLLLIAGQKLVPMVSIIIPPLAGATDGDLQDEQVQDEEGEADRQVDRVR